MTVASSASLRSSTRPAASAWHSSSPVSSDMKMCWQRWPSCSSREDHLPMSGQTMALNLSQRRSRNGSPKSASQPSTSRPVRLGKNGCNESFNGSLRDELLNGEMVYCLAEAKVLTKAWRRHYNTVRPQRSLPLPTAGTRSRSIASAVLRFRYASPPANTGDGGNHALTIRQDHSLGADQSARVAWPDLVTRNC